MISAACMLAGLLLLPEPAPRAIAQGPAFRTGEPRLEVLMINGGGRPAINYQSHLLHVRALLELVEQAGIPHHHVHVFSADGSDPEGDLAVRDPQSERNFWLLRGTRLEQPLRPSIRFTNSEIEGVELQPATPEALRAWFEAAALRLRPCDTLLLYVTDHGTRNKDDTQNNYITLWGEEVSMSVAELGELLALLDPGVRVVMLMSQCYSGAFANLMYTASSDGPPGGEVCGYFSSTADRPAYGCYAENRDQDNVGHSFEFIEALNATASLSQAHKLVLVNDQTPDVPLRTSDAYLEALLQAAAGRQGVPFSDLADELLEEGWSDKQRWEPQIRLLDRIGEAFGYFSPRLLGELDEQSELLEEVSTRFGTYNARWREALQALTRENLRRFLAANPRWEERLSADSLAVLDDASRRDLTAALMAELLPYTRGDTATWTRLRVLRSKSSAAAGASYRMQVRLGVVLRMKALLTRIAGQVYLECCGTLGEIKAYEALTACENLHLPPPPQPVAVPGPHYAFPSYEQELDLVDMVMPGWMGIRFGQPGQTSRSEHDLEAGAVTVINVFPDSPAQEAGLEVGDIILGPVDEPFSEPTRIREWVMTSDIGVPKVLLVRRGSQEIELTLTPQAYPLKWPELPSPPAPGQPAPALSSVAPYRGDIPSDLAEGGPYLLFFWATWCAPCKAALPEVLAFEQAKDTRVIAITDERPAVLDTFFAHFEQPFPETVGYDERRQMYYTYGLSGTPAFIWVDDDGNILKMWTGYAVGEGLPIPGWVWSRPGAAPDGRD